MNGLVLRELDITNFRSIRGHVHAPLDANVVLIHGENGAGKTSLLSAIELALTGGIQSLQRADPNYVAQLLHRSAQEGAVRLQALEGQIEQLFAAHLDKKGVRSLSTLSAPLAGFFRERTFLPQSLLGQLLQIYQDSGSGADSPLAKFVGNLLGLDQLDALEVGLKPFGDVRNVRKNVDGWAEAENEKGRLDRIIADQARSKALVEGEINASLLQLATLCAQLQINLLANEETLDEIAANLEALDIEPALQQISDQQRRLVAIQREISQADSNVLGETKAPRSDDAGTGYKDWEVQHLPRFERVRSTVNDLLPNISLPIDYLRFAEFAIPRLDAEAKQLTEQLSQARADITRYNAAQIERNVEFQRSRDIDLEINNLPSTSASLGKALAELSAFVVDDVCPVCDRDFGDLKVGPLGNHIHRKVLTLSTSAERLLTLGRSRSENSLTVERLDGEIEALLARQLDAKTLADLDRRAADVTSVSRELTSMQEILREGSRLMAEDVSARRAVNEVQSRSLSLVAAQETLNEFARSIKQPILGDGETFTTGAARLNESLSGEIARLEGALSARRAAAVLVTAIRASVARRKEIERSSSADVGTRNRAANALEAAQRLRDQALSVRDAVDTVRSKIIRREFNDRLNLLWRDLFVRLAPGEPFVPAFSIPVSGTQRLQPKLVTQHRDGGESGGTPGAMLSAGNLNTAALTLFVALHLSVPVELPWLILDDPVQSMDDVHIAHFAALLRTLSKEHGRQVMIAVHDRQLFEYLKLELSPAFPEDSLLTLELSRGPRRDSICIAKRHSFREEPSLYVAA